MKQVICDKCHKVLVKHMYFKLEQTNHWNNIPDKKFHLCEDCYDKFCNFLEGKKTDMNYWYEPHGDK